MKKNFNPHIYLFCFLLSLMSIAYADDSNVSGVTATHEWPKLNFYVGFGMGVGTTDWSQLVDHDYDPLVDLSAPTSVNSGGMTTDLFVGYKILDRFAIEARYVHYPQASIHFRHVNMHEILPIDPIPTPVPNPYGLYDFSTDTNSVAIVGKFYVPIVKRWHLRAFADVGINYTQRKDIMVGTQGDYMPTFGGGIVWRFAPRFQTSFEFQYAVGDGASTFDPVKQFMPFLYNADLRLAYLFNI
tara:strand:- start:33607 stop:34332 length:726 start_codon:yes stop_codon:yes gene_type:complete